MATSGAPGNCNAGKVKVNRSQADPRLGGGKAVPVTQSVTALYLAGTIPATTAVTVDRAINNGIFSRRFTDSRVININITTRQLLLGPFFRSQSSALVFLALLKIVIVKAKIENHHKQI